MHVTSGGSQRPPPGKGEIEPEAPRKSLVVPRGSLGREPARARRETSGDALLHALRARSLEERRALALSGLARLEHEDPDPEMEALLLRQLYLAELESGDDLAALGIAEEMIDLGTLGDVARQDAARAALGLEEIDVAADHLRAAAEIGPPERRAFHLATLGALLRFSGRALEAVPVLARAAQCAKADRWLYVGQWALAERAAGQTPSTSLAEVRQALEDAGPSRKGYALCILGEVCSVLGDDRAARDYLTRFLDKLEGAPRAKALALAGEAALARSLLGSSS